jgi:hypothetical protein
MALLCNDHARLSTENSLLKDEVNSLKDLTKVYIQSDSLKNSQLDLYKQKSKSDERKIKRMKKSRNGILAGSGIIITLLLILNIVK